MIFQLNVSFKQIVADFSPYVVAVPHGLESTGTKQQPNVQDEAADISRFHVISNEDIEELKSVAVNKIPPVR